MCRACHIKNADHKWVVDRGCSCMTLSTESSLIFDCERFPFPPPNNVALRCQCTWVPQENAKKRRWYPNITCAACIRAWFKMSKTTFLKGFVQVEDVFGHRFIIDATNAAMLFPGQATPSSAAAGQLVKPSDLPASLYRRELGLELPALKPAAAASGEPGSSLVAQTPPPKQEENKQ